MATRKAITFEHTNTLGNAPAYALFERVRIGRNIDGEFRKIDRRLDNHPPARQFSDYMVEIDRDGLPDGIEIIEWARGEVVMDNSAPRPSEADGDPIPLSALQHAGLSRHQLAAVGGKCGRHARRGPRQPSDRVKSKPATGDQGLL